MKYTLFVNKIVQWINRLGCFGATRFKIVKFIYDVFEDSNSRKGEWNFALKYLPDVRPAAWPLKKTIMPVLDVGSCESLFLYELDFRGYITWGLDHKDYQEKLKKIPFFKVDISDPNLIKEDSHFFGYFYYIVAISTIEHVGLGAYGDPKRENGDRLAMENIYKLLREDGFVILTIPMRHWFSPTGRGYNMYQFKKLIEGLFDIFEITQTHGQLCAALYKTGMREITYLPKAGDII